MERDAHLQSLFFLFFSVPSKGALSPGSLHRAPIEIKKVKGEVIPLQARCGPECG